MTFTNHLHRLIICFLISFLGELQRQKEFEVAMFMYRTGEQQNAYNAMNSTKILGNFLFITASFVVLRFLKKCISLKFFGPKKFFPLYFHTCSLQVNEQ